MYSSLGVKIHIFELQFTRLYEFVKGFTRKREFLFICVWPNDIYDQLQTAINQTSKRDLVIVMGDFNAKVGSDRIN